MDDQDLRIVEEEEELRWREEQERMYWEERQREEDEAEEEARHWREFTNAEFMRQYGC